MQAFAWTRKPKGEEAPGPDPIGPETTSQGAAAVAVAERPPAPLRTMPEPQRAPAAPDFVYQPWRANGLRRLYVNLADGTNIGFLDLATLEAVPESVSTVRMLEQGLAGLSPFTASGRHSQHQPATPVEEQPQAPARREREPGPAMPWTDLAVNRPGMLIEDQPDASYRAGVAGEQRTAGVLALLERQGFRVLHSVPLSPRKDIDHLVIGPSGIWAINTKATTYDVTAQPDGSVLSDGYRQKWVESIARDAAVAGEHLSTAARMELHCRPLMAVWSTMSVSSSHPSLVAGERVAAALTGQGPGYPPEWVDVVHSVARRSDTWTAHH